MPPTEHARVLTVFRQLGEFCDRALAAYDSPMATEADREQIVEEILSMVGGPVALGQHLFPPIPPIYGGGCDIQLSAEFQDLLARIEQRIRPPM